MRWSTGKLIGASLIEFERETGLELGREAGMVAVAVLCFPS